MNIAQISQNIFSLGLQRLLVDTGIPFILITFKFDLLLNNAFLLALSLFPSSTLYLCVCVSEKLTVISNSCY